MPDYINHIAADEKYREEYYQRTGWRAPKKSMEVPSPWTSNEDFRRTILTKLYATFDDWGEGSNGKGIEHIVSHRPEKLRLVGGLHNDMPHGSTKECGVYARRKQIGTLLPKKKTDSATWVKDIRSDRIRKVVKENLAREGIEVKEIRPKRGRHPIKFIDRKTGETADCDKVRKALSDLRMPSGVPIRSIRIRVPITKPVEITSRKDGVTRFYESDNNHHMEILKDITTKKWSGDLVRMKDAAERNIERLRTLKEAGVPSAREMRKLKRENPKRYREEREYYRPIIKEINQKYAIVNRNDRDGKEFVISLAIGESIHMQHKRTKEPGCFVVFKLDKDKIYLTPHWDARRAKGAGVDNPRDEFYVTPSQLKDLIIRSKEGIPEKICVRPLGDVKILVRD